MKKIKSAFSVLLLSLSVILFLTSGAVQAAFVPDYFNPDVDGYVLPIVEQSDGKILIGGNFSTVGGVTRHNIARLNTDGSYSSTKTLLTNTAWTIVP
jgi:hypothetical protein